jgi:hypothetical protein
MLLQLMTEYITIPVKVEWIALQQIILILDWKLIF